MHGRAGYVCVTEPEQRSALNRCTCQKLASRVGSAPVARRGAPAPAAPSACSASNVHNSPTQSTPGLRAQFLKTRHRRLRRGSSSHAMRSSAAADGDHAGLSGIRCASLANGATHTFVAAAAGQHNDGARCRGDGGLDGFDVVVLRRGRCRGAELRERAAPRGRRPGTYGHYSSLNLRSVSQRVVVGAQGGPAGAQEGNR